MKRFATAAATLALALTLPGAAFAYVGPGAGLSLLGALWALIVAIAVAVAFVVAWPVRRFLRRKRAAGASPVTEGEATVTGRTQESHGS